MKAFIYTKDKESRKIREISGVTSVYENKEDRIIIFCHEDGIETRIDTKRFKTVTYQN